MAPPPPPQQQHNPAHKRQVYLVCRAVFTGDKAKIRQLKKVRRVFETHRVQLRPLTTALGETRAIEIVRDLLERHIFESDFRAKLEFPELFRSDPRQHVRREASEVDAARDAAKALDDVISVAPEPEPEPEPEPVPVPKIVPAPEPEPDPESDEEIGGFTVIPNGNGARLGSTKAPVGPAPSTATKPAQPKPAAPIAAALPSLYPIYIPYTAQHFILSEAQRLLEESCFEFLGKWLPDVVAEKKWECAAAAELTESTRLLARHVARVPREAFVNLESGAVAGTGEGAESPAAALPQILAAASRLRHCAVHRLPSTARGVRGLCGSARVLAAALGDAGRAARLGAVCAELDAKIEAMKLSKNALEDAAADGLADIRRRREELDREEREVLARVVREDAENKAFMGALLREEVARILGDDDGDGDGDGDGLDVGIVKDEEVRDEPERPGSGLEPEPETEPVGQEPQEQAREEQQVDQSSRGGSETPSVENGKPARTESRAKTKIPKMNITCTIA